MNKKDLKTALGFASTDRTRHTIHGVRVEPGTIARWDAIHRGIVIPESAVCEEIGTD